jgi:hypothetical protein
MKYQFIFGMEIWLKKLDAWVGNSMSCGGRTIILDTSLSGVLTYHMLMFYLNETFI